jgi:hypothetical protein
VNDYRYPLRINDPSIWFIATQSFKGEYLMQRNSVRMALALPTVFVIALLVLLAAPRTANPAQAQAATAAATMAPTSEKVCSGELPIVGKGPNGETATPLSELSLTAQEEDKIRAGNYKVAIAMHYLGDDWPQLQVKGITETLAKYNIKVIGVTDGEQKVEKQIADIESLIQLKPDLIFTIPNDNDGLAPVTKKIVQSGKGLPGAGRFRQLCHWRVCRRNHRQAAQRQGQSRPSSVGLPCVPNGTATPRGAGYLQKVQGHSTCLR